VDPLDARIRRNALAKMAAPEDEVSRGPVTAWAPTDPGELATSGGMSIAAPMLISRLMRSPISLPQALSWGIGPLSLPISAVADTAGIAASPLADPKYQSGERGYFEALGPGLENQIRYMGQKSREARERYGPLGIPVQALHGIWNPVSGTAYMLKNLRDTFLDKAGHAALRAEQAIARSLKEASHAV